MINLYALSSGEGIAVRLVLSRIDLAGRIIGVLAIFAASIHSAGIKSRHQGYVLAVILLISFSLSYLFPLASSSPSSGLLFTSAGDQANIDILCTFVALISLLNFIKNAVVTRDHNDFLFIFPMLLLLFGHFLLSTSLDWWMLLPAWLSLVSGSYWTIRYFMSSYLWY